MSVKSKISVATIIEHEGRFLMVEERTSNGKYINQPSGGIEFGEIPQDAAVREVLEETKHSVTLDGFVGAYQLFKQDSKTSYTRLCFHGHSDFLNSYRPNDRDIVRVLWMTYEDIASSINHHKNPIVMQSLNDYINRQSMPLNVVRTLTM